MQYQDRRGVSLGTASHTATLTNLPGALFEEQGSLVGSLRMDCRMLLGLFRLSWLQEMEGASYDLVL